jgi:glucose/arabinose dehydrogenase
VIGPATPPKFGASSRWRICPYLARAGRPAIFDDFSRPRDAQLHVPDGFRIEEYAAGLRDPRVLLTAPNGDIFVTESRANQIKVMRDKDGDGKPETTQIFSEAQLNKPFGIAFYPPGDDPQYLYVANTDGVIRFPYRNGDLEARGPAEKLGAHLSPGGLLRGGGHWTRNLASARMVMALSGG